MAFPFTVLLISRVAVAWAEPRPNFHCKYFDCTVGAKIGLDGRACRSLGFNAMPLRTNADVDASILWILFANFWDISALFRTNLKDLVGFPFLCFALILTMEGKEVEPIFPFSPHPCLVNTLLFFWGFGGALGMIGGASGSSSSSGGRVTSKGAGTGTGFTLRFFLRVCSFFVLEGREVFVRSVGLWQWLVQ